MSAEGRLQVERAGPLALLQDAGRFGVRRLGVTQGGPADIHAWAWANHLLGNAWGAPALEIALGGLSLVADSDTTLALAGADLGARLDDEPLDAWTRIEVKRGQRLCFDAPKNGLWAYLAVPAGFIAAPMLGSVAGVAREELGGHDGRGGALQTGDTLAFHAERLNKSALPALPERDEQPDYARPARLELIAGAQIAEFTGASLFAAFNRPWHVDQRADRMGVRLDGPPLTCRLASMISEGLTLGAVQVPPDGQPIVLLNDRQTIGGYPRLGTLTPLACARLAQCPPSHEVHLRVRGLEASQLRYRRFLQQFRHA